MPDATVTLTLAVERKLPSLPRYVVVPAPAIAHWKLDGTTLLEVSLDGRAADQRTIKRWDEARWFVTITQPDCDKGGFDTGDRVRVALARAKDELPAELARLLGSSAAAKAAWNRHTPSQQRMIREHVRGAKQSATREARARRALLGGARSARGARAARS